MVGQLAISRAGHDKGTFYLIIKEDGNNVYLTDGVYKPYAAPKRKNRKHIQPIHTGMTQEELAGLEDHPAEADTVIKRFIKLYSKRNDQEVIYV